MIHRARSVSTAHVRTYRASTSGGNGGAPRAAEAAAAAAAAAEEEEEEAAAAAGEEEAAAEEPSAASTAVSWAEWAKGVVDSGASSVATCPYSLGRLASMPYSQRWYR